MRVVTCRLAAVAVAACAAFVSFPGQAANNAAFISQSVPGTMALGQSYPVSVTMQNTGDTTWSSSALYRLGSQDPQDNTSWGLLRVDLPSDVLPGSSVTFNFSVTAPSVVGSYNFRWRMVQDNVEWFGETTTNVVVKDGQNNAVFVSQSIPSVMVPGQSYPVTVTMKNVGTTTWTSDKLYRLGSQNPQDSSTWSVTRVALPNAVAPGDSVTFQFTMVAPARAGHYDAQYSMVQDNVEWFGEPTANVAVVDGLNAAAFVYQSVPSVVVPGQSYPVTVTMHNAGNTTWTAEGLYRLGSQNVQDNTMWGVQRVSLAAPVPPGGDATFSFTIAAPNVPGLYTFQWQMVEDGVDWFGAPSDNVSIKDGQNDAAFVGQSVPTTMTAGNAYPVTVTMQNTGTTRWSAGSLFRLGSQRPQDNATWSVQRVELPADVPPGGQATFAFNVTAPAAPGSYDFQWGMVQDNVAWFGALTTDASVSVQPAFTGNQGLDVQIAPVSDGDVYFEDMAIDLIADSTQSTVGVASTQLALNGATVASAQGSSAVHYGWTRLVPGTYVISATVVGSDGSLLTKSTTMSVIVAPEDIPIRAVLDNFKAALASGNEAQALSFMTQSAQASYGPVLDMLMPNMAQIVSDWTDAKFIDGTDESVDYAVTRTTDGVTRIFVITFVLDDNGNWLIDSL